MTLETDGTLTRRCKLEGASQCSRGSAHPQSQSRAPRRHPAGGISMEERSLSHKEGTSLEEEPELACRWEGTGECLEPSGVGGMGGDHFPIWSSTAQNSDFQRKTLMGQLQPSNQGHVQRQIVVHQEN